MKALIILKQWNQMSSKMYLRKIFFMLFTFNEVAKESMETFFILSGKRHSWKNNDPKKWMYLEVEMDENICQVLRKILYAVYTFGLRKKHYTILAILTL